MAVIDPVGLEPSPGWFQQAYRILFASQQSGTTAQRPTSQLWTGRVFFDTSLGIPIWYDGSAWVDSTGASV